MKPALKAVVPQFMPRHNPPTHRSPSWPVAACHAGFQNKQGLQNRTFDGRNCIIGQPLVYRDANSRLYRTEEFLRTDGGSVPPLSFIGAMMIAASLLCAFSYDIFKFHWLQVVTAILSLTGFSTALAGLYLKSFGRWWFSYVFHDALFQDKVEISDDDGATWRHHSFSEAECNDLLREAMRGQRAAPWERGIVWLMLNLFGWRAFDADRRAACAHIEPSKPWPRK